MPLTASEEKTLLWYSHSCQSQATRYTQTHAGLFRHHSPHIDWIAVARKSSKAAGRCCYGEHAGERGTKYDPASQWVGGRQLRSAR